MNNLYLLLVGALMLLYLAAFAAALLWLALRYLVA
jgi:hypothetical protein